MFKTISLLTLLAAGTMASFEECNWPDVSKAVGVVPEWVSKVELTDKKAEVFVKCPQNGHLGVSFNMALSPKTAEVLDMLESSKTRGTFFVSGSNALQHAETLKKIAAGGHEIGVHGWSHASFDTLTKDEIITEIMWTVKVVQEVIGKKPKMIRAPFGSKSDHLQQIAAALDMKIVSYSDLTNDHIKGTTEEEVKKRVAAWKQNEKRPQGVIAGFNANNEEQVTLLATALEEADNVGFKMMSIGQCRGWSEEDMYDTTKMAIEEPKEIPESREIAKGDRVDPNAEKVEEKPAEGDKEKPQEIQKEEEKKTENSAGRTASTVLGMMVAAGLLFL